VTLIATRADDTDRVKRGERFEVVADEQHHDRHAGGNQRRHPRHTESV